jgi:spore germination protein
MLPINNKISIRQLQILLILESFGVGIVILPRRVVEFADQDGWIVIILATLLAMIYAFIITSVGKIFPQDSFKTYSSKILSKPIGTLLTIGFILKILLTTALELRFFGEILQQTILPKTPFSLVCFIMLCLCGFAASKGFETRARIGEILIFLIFIPLAIVFFIAIFDIDFTNIMPIMVTSPSSLLRGAVLTGLSFTGLEFCLLIYPYANNPKNVRKGIVTATSLIGMFMLIITLITIAKFGPSDLKMQLWPVFEMMDLINLPGSFIERQGALIVSFWIISIFAIVNAGLFFSSLLLKDIAKVGKHSYYIIFCVIVVFFIALLPKNTNDILKLMDIVFITFGVAYAFFIPLILLIVAKVRRLG